MSYIQIWLLLWQSLFAQSIPFPGPGRAPTVSPITVTTSANETASDASGSTQVTLSTTATNHPAGIGLVGFFRMARDIAFTPTFSNTAGDTWSCATTRYHSNTDTVLWCYVISSLGNANDVVTVTTSAGGCIYCSLRVYRVANITGLDVDTTVPAVVSGTVTSSTFTTTHAASVVFMGVDTANVGSSYGAGSGYTLNNDTNGISATQYQIFSSIQSMVTASLTVTPTNVNNYGSLVSFYQ